MEALADHRSRPDRVWNRIPDDVRGQIIDLALEIPELSPRELGACQNFCVRPVARHEFTKRSLNITANCVLASAMPARRFCGPSRRQNPSNGG